ncbi:MAG: glycosyltransferase family 2 protein [Candidatus Melainabacteria bacterium]|nr:glycosyltransferase family 2 protein [Candidatus Melainabacteria bacterium]
MSRPYLSVILPVYKCGSCLPPLYSRLSDYLSEQSVDFEVIFVDDRGDESDWNVIESLAKCDDNLRIRAFRHRLNYGQAAAIASGFSRARGDYCLVMDADLQDPPECIGSLLSKARQGSDIVLAVKTRRRDSIARCLADAAVRKLLPVYTRFPNSLDYGSFALISRAVADRYLAAPDRNSHFVKLLDRQSNSTPGTLTSFVYYEPESRYHGPSSYSFFKLLHHNCVLMGPAFWSEKLKVSTIASIALLLVAMVVHLISWESFSGMELVACLLTAAGVIAFWSAIFCQYARFVSTRPLRDGPVEVAERIDRIASLEMAV